jgi:hypothetical protein
MLLSEKGQAELPVFLVGKKNPLSDISGVVARLWEGVVTFETRLFLLEPGG